MGVITTKRNCAKLIALGLILQIISFSAAAARTIQGIVLQADGMPAADYRVRALDSDMNADDLMGEDLTDERGHYKIVYRKGGWDSKKSRYHTQRRPDIYIVVSSPEPGGGWKRVDQTGIDSRKNHNVRNDITQDFLIPAAGECPYPAKFDTTAFLNNCKCPSYKRWLDLDKKNARCAEDFEYVNVRTWKTKDNPEHFPEINDPTVSVPWLHNRPSFGIAFSGGGTRSAAATLGLK